MKDSPAIWSRKLNDALWDFRTAYKTPTGTTPYKLVYRKNYHLPFKIKHRAYWALKNCNPDYIAAGNGYSLKEKIKSKTNKTEHEIGKSKNTIVLLLYLIRGRREEETINHLKQDQVDVVFDGAFRGVRIEEVGVGEGVVVTSSSLEMLTNIYLGGMIVNLIFMEGFEEEAFVEFMVEFG
ncbi:reverse transcriptase domain-containing protein [Tanacetum coccineum]